LRKAELDKAAADFALLSEQKAKKENQLEQAQESLENAEKDIQVRQQIWFMFSDLTNIGKEEADTKAKRWSRRAEERHSQR